MTLSQTIPHVLLFEPDFRGHRASNVSILLSYLYQERPPIKVTFALHPEILPLLDDRHAPLLEKGSCPQIAYLPLNEAELEQAIGGRDHQQSFYRWCKRGVAQWRLMAQLLERSGAEHGHFFVLDEIVFPLMMRYAMPSGKVVSGLFFRPSMHYAETQSTAAPMRERLRDWLKAIMWKAALKNPALDTIFSLDPYFPNYAARHFDRGDRVVAVPDPVVFPGEAKGELGLSMEFADGRKLFLLFGALAPRKGIDTLIEACHLLSPEQAESMAILLAGRVDKVIRDDFLSRLRALQLAQPRLAVHLEDRYVSDDELAHLVQRADVILAPYHRHIGSSGVLYWAAQAGKPVISQNYGLIGMQVREFDLGLSIEPRDARSLAQAMGKAAVDHPAKLCDPQGQKAFCSGHRGKDFAEALLGPMMQTPAKAAA